MNLSQYFTFERTALDRLVRNLVINLLPDLWIVDRCARPFMARLCGMKCGRGVILQRDIFYGNPRNVRIGDRSAVSRGAFLDGYDTITIGNNVAVAFGVTFITSTHELGNQQKRTGEVCGKPIVVGDGVWIAARAIIGPGVEIGAGSMIAAGAAVMQSVPPNSLVVGVPGKVITRLGGGGALTRSSEPLAAAPAASAQKALPAAPTDATRREKIIVAPAPGANRPESVATPPEPASSSVGYQPVMTKAEFYAELESLLELERGSIHGTESLADLPHWDSMAVLAFIALADAKLHEVASPAALASCRTVADLVKLFPGKIT